MNAKRPTRLVIVDDDEYVIDAMSGYFEDKGFHVQSFFEAESLLKNISKLDCDIIVIDLDLPGRSGIDVLPDIKKQLDVPVIILTGFGNIETAVEAMKNGAYEFLTKPLAPQLLYGVITNALAHKELLRENQSLKNTIATNQGTEGIIGTSPHMRRVCKVIHRIAPTDVSVLILGETGTGKEIVARAIHKLSSRAKGPFLPVNCAALNASIAESVLFGHNKGAFTGAQSVHHGLVRQAEEGTLLLDEIGLMPMEIQGKLLRLLEDKSYHPIASNSTIKADIRFISSTNSNITSDQSSFRQDLLYRLNTVTINLPPLRERRQDIALLAIHFLTTYGKSIGRNFKGFSPQVLKILYSYDWPGNVRELRNIVESAAIFCDGEVIESLPDEFLQESPCYTIENLKVLSTDKGSPLGAYDQGKLSNRSLLKDLPEKENYVECKEELVDAFDRRYFDQLLTDCNGFLKAASKKSGLPYRTILRKLKDLGMNSKDYKPD
jgi:DNA-binding NtrC family response regulator